MKPEGEIPQKSFFFSFFLHLAGGEIEMARAPLIWLKNRASQITSVLLKEPWQQLFLSFSRSPHPKGLLTFQIIIFLPE